MSNTFFQEGENFSRGGFVPHVPPWLQLRAVNMLQAPRCFHQTLIAPYPNVFVAKRKSRYSFKNSSTFLFIQLFSEMSINKTKLCSRFTCSHMNDITKLATTHDLTPHIDALVKEKIN